MLREPRSCQMSIARDDMTTTQAQFETWLGSSPVLQSLQSGFGRVDAAHD